MIDLEEVALVLRAAQQAVVQVIDEQREALTTINTGLDVIERDRARERSDSDLVLSDLVAITRTLGRRLCRRVRDDISIDVHLTATPENLRELVELGVNIDPQGGRAIYRSGCAELHIQLSPGLAPAKEIP